MTRQPGKSGNRVWMFAKWILLIAVLAAVVAVSIPAYQQYVIRITRTDAKRELQELSQRLQRCFARTGNYELQDSVNPCVSLPQATPDNAYLITGEIEANTFELTAMPQSGQANDAECGAYTLDQSGGQGVTGSGTEEGCW